MTYIAMLTHADDRRFVTVLPSDPHDEAAAAHRKELENTPGQRVAGSFIAQLPEAVARWVAGLKEKNPGLDVFVWIAELCRPVKLADPVTADVIESAIRQPGEYVDFTGIKAEIDQKTAEVAESAVATMSEASAAHPVEWAAPEDATVSVEIGSPDETDKSDEVNHPSHYVTDGFECIDVIKSALSYEEFCGFLRGNVLKYHFRALNKGGLEDIRKAGWYQRRLEQALDEASK